MAAVGGTAVLGWATLRDGGLMGGWSTWTADYATATGEVREFALPGGTRVVLNTASAVDVDFSGAERRLRLLAGEALFGGTGGRNPRPLVVTSPQGALRAGGAHVDGARVDAREDAPRFALRLEGATALLTVFEGVVNIDTSASASGQRRRVPAGQQVRFDARRLSPSEPADAARQSWSRGVLLAQDIPLGELIAELGRYSRRHYSVAPEVASLRVLGGYPWRDPDRVLTMLQSVLPIRVRRPLPWWVSIGPR